VVSVIDIEFALREALQKYERALVKKKTLDGREVFQDSLGWHRKYFDIKEGIVAAAVKSLRREAK
jgi:hypothetical protein